MANRPKLEHESAERILDISWELFQRKGYKGVTVDEICARCNLTKPTLYYYFKDKEDLFVKVLQRKLQLFHSEMERPGTVEDHLWRTATAILDNFQTQYSVLWHDREHIQKPENQLAVREAFRAGLFNPLQSVMQTGIDDGLLRGKNAFMLTLMFLGVVNNFIGRANDFDLETKSLAEEITLLFLEGAYQK